MTPAPARPATIWAALISVYIVWGSTYLAIRVVVEADIPPLLGMGVRFLTAGALVAGFLFLRGGRDALRISRRSLRGTLVMGTLLLFLGNGVVAIAEQTVPSGLAALIVGAVPLWFVVFRVGGGDRPGWLTWTGVLVGFAGVAAISLPGGGIDGVELWGVGLILFATLSWAIGSYLSPRLSLPAHPLVAVTYEMLAGGAIMTLVSLVSGEAAQLNMSAVPAKGWIALGYLVLFGSILGYTAYGYALAHAPLSLVGTYAYVNPVVAVFLGWAILAEPITTIVVTGGALVVAGVALVVTGERTNSKRADKVADIALDPQSEMV